MTPNVREGLRICPPAFLGAVFALAAAMTGCFYHGGRDDSTFYPTKNCAATQALVVDNQTGYPVSVVANEGGPNAFPGSWERLGSVQNRRVDTLIYLAPTRPMLSFTVERPATTAGAPVRGLRAWCIATK